MLSRKFGSVFDDDPFFEGHRRHMEEMNKIFCSPFEAFRWPLGLEDSPRGRRERPQHRHGNEVVGTRSLFDFRGMDSMFSSMQEMMNTMQQNFDKVARDPDNHMLSHTSFASYSNMDGSKPKMFQATTTSRQAPGGIRETRKTLRDSESGKEKMAIGRYIGDRGHVIQRQRNRHSGEEEENQEYVNLGEDDASEFDREWKDWTHRYGERQIDRGRHGHDRDQHHLRALPTAGGRNKRAGGRSDRD